MKRCKPIELFNMLHAENSCLYTVFHGSFESIVHYKKQKSQ